ncbi:MAG: efflux RND transporter periplasmic adaptor subunit [Anaerolineae bacterium]|nr:efflux RND transporter periplasmic adaptor subunit [Gloeobacterales cyanobacterium ES-bin-313]
MRNFWAIGLCVSTVLITGCSETKKAPDATAMAAISQRKMPADTVELSPESLRNQALRVETVGRRQITDHKVFPASIEEAANRSSTVSVPIAGRIQQISVDVGSRVRAGQIVATLNSTELGSAKADLLSAKANLLAVKSRLLVSKSQSQRESYLAERGISSQREKQEAQVQLSSAQAQYEGAKTAIQAAEARLLALGLVESEVSQLINGKDITPRLYARSPVAGQVLVRKARVGQVVQPGEALFNIADLSEVWVVLKVFQSDLGRLQVGDRVRFSVRGEQTVNGRVLLVSDTLDPQTRTADVRVVIPNPDHKLKPGMLVQAEVDFGGSSREVLAIPEQAIYEVNGKRVVFIREAMARFVARPITVGNRIGTYVEVLSGLKAGEAIVVEGGFVLKAELLKS